MAKKIILFSATDYRVLCEIYRLILVFVEKKVSILYFSYLTVVNRPKYKHISPFETLKHDSGIFPYKHILYLNRVIQNSY